MPHEPESSEPRAAGEAEAGVGGQRVRLTAQSIDDWIHRGLALTGWARGNPNTVALSGFLVGTGCMTHYVHRALAAGKFPRARLATLAAAIITLILMAGCYWLGRT